MSDDHSDFDENTPPPEGTIRSVMRRHSCSRRQALKLMGLPVPKRKSFGALDVGDRFRFNSLIWQKIEPQTDSWWGHSIEFTARCLGDDHGNFKAEEDRASIADHVLVDPIDEPQTDN